jgi:hypothetical protein
LIYIKSTSAPEHFQADIEIDNWVKMKDSWLKQVHEAVGYSFPKVVAVKYISVRFTFYSTSLKLGS